MASNENLGLERIFPGLDEVDDDILDGITDFTDGKATEYFRSLGQDDRELVQWYLLQGLGNAWSMPYYLDGLVEGYAMIDPKREATPAIDAAHQEVNRIARFTDLFISAEGFFPELIEVSYSVCDDSTGEIVRIREQGWNALGHSQLPQSKLDYQKHVFSSEITPRIKAAHSFLDDPNDNSYYDQSEIEKNHIEGKDESISVIGD